MAAAEGEAAIGKKDKLETPKALVGDEQLDSLDWACARDRLEGP
jgi:hypothetical protein